MEIELEPVFKAFLLTEIDLELENFNQHSIKNNNDDIKYLYISDDCHFVHKVTENKELFILGYCMDIRDNSLSTAQIADNLVKITDIQKYYDEVEYLNGRFTILSNDIRGISVSTDATSMRPVFYNEDFKVISSHEYILRIVMTDQFGAKLTQNPQFRKGFLDFTYYNEIYKLNPSLELSFNDFSKVRIFPRNNKGVLSLDQCYESLYPYFIEIQKWLKNQSNKYFSLTGGQDSRLTLAILKPIIEDINFFTYLRPRKSFKKNKEARKKYLNDKSIVREMVDNLNLNHEFFQIPKIESDDEYNEYLNETMSSNHSYGLSKYFTKNKNFYGALHIKSTVQSIIKSSFPKDLYMRNDINSVVEALQMWGNTSGALIEGNHNFKNAVFDYLNRNQLSYMDIYDYHQLDILFLEVRLGNFQSSITQETDNTLEIFNIVNSRKMIQILLSPKLEHRQTLALNKKLINTFWPVLNFFGINDEPDNLYEKVNYLISDMDDAMNRNFLLTDELEVVKRNNITISKSNTGLILTLTESPILPEENYPFELVNHSDKNKKIRMTSTYKNPNGKGVIFVVSDDFEKDIQDLNNGIDIVVPARNSIRFLYVIKEIKHSPSWKNAARLLIRT